jgi:hypothetical protein
MFLVLVPHAMQSSGIVVVVSAMALVLILMLRVNGVTVIHELPDRDRDRHTGE